MQIRLFYRAWVLGFLLSGSLSWAVILPSSVPQKISLIVSGPGSTMTSIMGHVDLLLSYSSSYTTEDLMVGFGPPADEKIEILRAMGWKKPHYPMTMWKTDLLSRFKEALEIKRKWLRIVPLNLSLYERSLVVKNIELTFERMGKVPYVAPSYNCSTLISELLGQAKERKIDSHLRHQPLKNIQLYKEFGWVRAEYLYSADDIKKIALRKR